MTRRLPKQSGLTSSSLFSGRFFFPVTADHRARDIRPNLGNISPRHKGKHVLHRAVPTSCHISQKDSFAFLILHLGVRVIISCLPSTILNRCLKQIPFPWEAVFHLPEAERGFQAAIRRSCWRPWNLCLGRVTQTHSLEVVLGHWSQWELDNRYQCAQDQALEGVPLTNYDND